MYNEEELKQCYSLAYVILPPSILELFTLVGVEVKKAPPSKNESVWADQDLHIYLDEGRNIPPEQESSYTPNGFTEETVVQDFPIRDMRVFLHVRRRRWLDAEGHNVVLNIYPLVSEGTRLSSEFGAFLKKKDGHIDGECEQAWGILPD